MPIYEVSITAFISARNKDCAIRKINELFEDDGVAEIDDIVKFSDTDPSEPEPKSNAGRDYPNPSIPHNFPDNYPGRPL